MDEIRVRIEDEPGTQAPIRAEIVEPKLIPSPVSGVVPPVAHRFRKGVSGNPSGKPKGFRPLDLAAMDILSCRGSNASELEAAFRAKRARKGKGLLGSHLTALAAFRVAADGETGAEKIAAFRALSGVTGAMKRADDQQQGSSGPAIVVNILVAE